MRDEKNEMNPAALKSLWAKAIIFITTKWIGLRTHGVSFAFHLHIEILTENIKKNPKMEMFVIMRTRWRIVPFECFWIYVLATYDVYLSCIESKRESKSLVHRQQHTKTTHCLLMANNNVEYIYKNIKKNRNRSSPTRYLYNAIHTQCQYNGLYSFSRW